MEQYVIAHEYTDSLKQFLNQHPNATFTAWLISLPFHNLIELEALLSLVLTQSSVRASNPTELINKTTDVHLLAFEVNNMGRKRRQIKIDSNIRQELMGRMLVEIQLICIQRNS